MEKKDFFTYADTYYRQRYNARQIAFRTLYNNQSQIRSFQRYCAEVLQSDTLPLSAIDAACIHEYKAWCMNRGNCISTVNQKLVPILSVIRRAGEEGLVPKNSSLYEVGLYLSSRPKRYGEQARNEADTKKRNRVRHLTDAQMRRLMRYYATSSKRARNTLDIFMFSFHACGLRVSDIVTLEWRHINFRKATLTKVLVKTKVPIVIPLSAPALDILGRWKAAGANPRFVFNLLPAGFDLSDDPALVKAIDYRNRALRSTLQLIGEKIGLPFPLGMHVARHTFAVKALNSGGVSVHLISRLLGHTSVLVTEKVYATFLLPTLSRQVRSRLSFTEFQLEQ